MNGILTGKESIQFFGNSIAFLVNTDKTEYTNVPILISLCRALLFDFSGILPLNICRENLSLPDGIKHGSEVLKKEQKACSQALLFNGKCIPFTLSDNWRNGYTCWVTTHVWSQFNVIFWDPIWGEDLPYLWVYRVEQPIWP